LDGHAKRTSVRAGFDPGRAFSREAVTHNGRKRRPGWQATRVAASDKTGSQRFIDFRARISRGAKGKGQNIRLGRGIGLQIREHTNIASPWMCAA
jgi:hypothetical protein